MFRIYSGIDQSAHLQRVQVWFEITDRFCVEVSRNSIFLQDSSTSSCLVYWREKYYLCWSSYQFELMKDLQMFEYSGVDTKCPYIHQSYRWTGISIFIILMLCIVCEYLSWSGTILCCYLKQCATRNILKEIHVSENSYPRRGIFSSGSPVYMPIVERSVLVQ